MIALFRNNVIADTRFAIACVFQVHNSPDFRWVQGEDLVSYYESSPGNRRGFCRVCGSPLLSRFDRDPSSYGLPFGALDDDPGVKPKLHVFVAYKAPWFEITDELPAKAP